jgi:cytochrome c-type biogenesis protein CcmH
LRHALTAAILVLASAHAAGLALDVEGGALSAEERRQLGEPAGERLAGGELLVRAREVASLLRCPVCQGLSVADSPVPAAQAMQRKVQALLAAGYSEEQVLAFFETSYGEFIRLSPKPEGFNLVVWVLPVLAILVGVGLVARRVRSAPAAAEDDLEAYRQRVRQEVQR